MTLMERLHAEEQRVRALADDLADVADRLRELVKDAERKNLLAEWLGAPPDVGVPHA